MLTDVRILAVDSVRVLFRRFPQILSIFLIGWLASQLIFQVAVVVGDHHQWAALVIFAASFLCTLVATVLILRLCGQELGIRQLMPDDEVEDDDRDASLTRLVAVTLLPFLGLYAAFGYVQDAADRLSTEQIFRNSILVDSVLTVVSRLGRQHTGWFLALLVGIYLARRALDELHERTGWQPVGVVVAFVEAVFMLLVIYGGFAIANLVGGWLGNRVFVGWLDAVKDAVLGLLARIDAQIPVVVLRGLSFFADHVWPVLWRVVSQPVVWLAVTALVFGSRVLSLAELWRKGQPLAARIPGASHFSRHRDKVALRRVGPPPAGVRRLASEFREAFLGDIDDKYLPTFHSLRLVLRAGLPFLGAYVFCYTVLQVLTNYVDRAFQAVLGGRDVNVWFVISPVKDLVTDVPLELLRLCLLAVAFRRCLELLQRRGGAEVPSVPSAVEVPA